MAEIGIMGGTFDPIHNGHLMLGRQAYEEYHLDEVWFMPSGNPPHKKDHLVTDAALRCKMVRLAIEGFPKFRLSEFFSAARRKHLHSGNSAASAPSLSGTSVLFYRRSRFSL